VGRRIVTGVLDPSGLNLSFELDGNRVQADVVAHEALCGPAKVLPPGAVAALADDVAHAAVAALKVRVGVARECRLRFLKPLYAGERVRVVGSMGPDNGDVFVVQVKLLNAKDQPCVEGEVEVFALTADQVRRMTPDGAVPAELRRYLP
jgi:acyl-coenzyme A thioesterase PaaI-like protein